MGKFVFGIVVGALMALVGCFLYIQWPGALLDQIHVVENYETEKITVRGNFSTPRVSIAPDGKPSFTVRRSDKGYLSLEAHLTPDITIEHTWLIRNNRIAWNGTIIPDMAGQQWEHVGAESHHTANREKYGEDIALAQTFWIGRMYTDGKDIFFENIYQGVVRSTWRKLPEPNVK